MVGSGLKKMAKEYQLNVDQGFVYGILYGQVVTFEEGMGTKTMHITTFFEDFEKREDFFESIAGEDLQRRFRVNAIDVDENSISIEFFDNPGTLPKIKEFIEWFLPQFQNSGAKGCRYCSFCGEEIFGYAGFKLIGHKAYYIHEACVNRVSQTLSERQDFEKRAQKLSGNYGTGFIGALLGALVGAIPWAIAYSFGWFVGWLGFVIGLISKKGYELLNGKNAKGKFFIVLLTSIIGVIVGNLVGDVLTLAKMIADGLLGTWMIADIPYIFKEFLFTDEAYIREFVMNVGMGLVFVFLGTYNIFREIHQETNYTSSNIKSLK